MTEPLSASQLASTTPATAIGMPASSQAVLMFTDIAGSTELKDPVNGIGGAAYARVSSAHDEIFRLLLAQVPGAEALKDVGDGFMARFPTTSCAVETALLFQYALAAGRWPDGLPRLRVRIGIQTGEVSVTGTDILGKEKLIGAAADLAARVQGVALPGQILLARAAFDDARNMISKHPDCGVFGGSGTVAPPVLHWVDHGRYHVKGVADPVEVFEVGAQGIAPLARPPASDKVRPARSTDEEALLGWRPGAGQDVPRKPGWVLTRRLGVGGFGEVWLGGHSRLNQLRVFKFCFDMDQVRSLKRELTLFRVLHEALGDRPDIARIHDVQLEHPPYALESEYCPGGDLGEWARAGRLDALTLEHRLELLAKIADAVAAAHSVGVLHKDIKPANILISDVRQAVPDIKLADFGIGVLIRRELLATHQIALPTGGLTIGQLTENQSSRTGTRMYAPPESLVVPPRPFSAQGDVYALGVLAYQVLVGDLSRPLAAGWERDIPASGPRAVDPGAIIREDIAAMIDGDLSLRVQTADEVARRLRTVIIRAADRVAEAAARAAAQEATRREIAAAERARSLEARRRRLVILATVAVILVIIVAGLAGFALVQRGRALENAAEAASLAEIARASASRAAANEQDARRESQAAQQARKRAEAITAFVIDSMHSSDPVQGGGNSQATIAEALENAARKIDNGAFRGDPLTEAALRTTIGVILQNNGRAADAVPFLEAALALRRAAAENTSSTDDDAREVVDSLHQLASALRAAGRTAESLPMFEEVVAARRDRYEANHEKIFECLTGLGHAMVELGRAPDAEPLFREAAAIARTLHSGDDVSVAIGLTNLAFVLLSLGRPADAVEPARDSFEMFKRIYRGGDHPDLMRSLHNYAHALSNSGRATEAEPMLREALAMGRRVYRGDHPDVAAFMSMLGGALAATGRTGEVESLFREALAMNRRIYGGDHLHLARSLNNLAAFLHSVQRDDEGCPLIKEACDMMLRLAPPDHPTTRNLLTGRKLICGE